VHKGQADEQMILSSSTTNVNESLSPAKSMNSHEVATSPGKEAASGVLSLVRLTAVSELRVDKAWTRPSASTITAFISCGAVAVRRTRKQFSLRPGYALIETP
jgi:hypothetical protein